MAVAEYVEERDAGFVIAGPSDVFLDESNVFEPDFYYVAKDNRRIIFEEGIRGAPDLAAEILSPEDGEQDRNEKREVYARSGVKEMWIVDLQACAIEVHFLTSGLGAIPEIIRAPEPFLPAMFPGLQINTERLFQPLA